MSNNLFKNVACFTDIHLGLKQNCRLHLSDCSNFIDWFIIEAKKRNSETCVFLGDWHHNRATVNVVTLTETIKQLQKLNDAFEKVYFITGNHDLYFRNNRSFNSVEMARSLPNFHLVDTPLTQGDVTILPWLVEDEFKKIPKIKSRYMFGHFEIPGFKMNAQVEMPDHGTLNKTFFKNQEYVFSGHFHKRQQRENIHYIGNPFGHTFSDAWDFERGAMFLEWGGKPEYLSWDGGPKYITTKVSKLVEYPEKYLLPNSFVKAAIDVDISYEEVTFLKEALVEQYKIRELKLINDNNEAEIEDTDVASTFETVDQIVLDSLKNIESDSFDVNTLMKIYNTL